MIRSGSTLSFNVARELLLRTGDVVTTFANSFGNLPNDSRSHFVLKSHAPDKSVTDEIKSGALACICTIRRPEDAIASFMRAFGFSLERSISEVDAWLCWHSSVFEHVLTVDYEAIEELPRHLVSRIDEFLSGEANDQRSYALAEKYRKSTLKPKLDRLEQNSTTIDLGFTYYDKDTFFHRRHISSIASLAASSTLSPSEICRVRTELSRFVDPDGNLKRIYSGEDGA